MTAPDMFAIGGRQDDPILALDAERQVLDERLSAFKMPCTEEGEISRQLIAVEDQILAAVPISVAGAAAQLRLLHGFADSFTWAGWHDRVIANVIAGLDQLAAGAAV